MINMRADALYCSDSCRKRKVREKEKDKEKDSDVITVEAEVVEDSQTATTARQTQEVIETESLKNNLTSEVKKCENEIKQLLYLKTNAEIEKNKQKGELSLLKKKRPDSIKDFILNSDFFRVELQKKIRVNSEQKLGRSTSELSTLTVDQLLKSSKVKNLYLEYKANFPKNLQNEIKNLKSLISSKSSEIKDFDEKIKRLDKDKSKLNGRLDKLIDSYLNVWRHNNKKTQVIQKNEGFEKSLTNSTFVEILNPNFSFEIFNFQDEGKYLGDVIRHEAFIFLTGAAGAGKTHFSLLLLKSFVKEKFRCAYFSLEEGEVVLEKTKSLGLKLSDFSLYVKKTGLCLESNIDLLREICKNGGKKSHFDAIFIDSWQKLEAEGKDVDILRAEFPKIIFVAISQVTKNGSMQGENNLYHNPTAILVVSKNKDNKRSVNIHKTRYGNQGEVYNL